MRSRVLRIMRYEAYDWMPVVHFGFWDELYEKWEAEGRIPCDAERKELGRGSGERMVAEKLGFDIGPISRVAFNQMLRQELNTIGRVVREANITAQ